MAADGQVYFDNKVRVLEIELSPYQDWEAMSRSERATHIKKVVKENLIRKDMKEALAQVEEIHINPKLATADEWGYPEEGEKFARFKRYTAPPPTSAILPPTQLVPVSSGKLTEFLSKLRPGGEGRLSKQEKSDIKSKLVYQPMIMDNSQYSNIEPQSNSDSSSDDIESCYE